MEKSQLSSSKSSFLTLSISDLIYRYGWTWRHPRGSQTKFSVPLLCHLEQASHLTVSHIFCINAKVSGYGTQKRRGDNWKWSLNKRGRSRSERIIGADQRWCEGGSREEEDCKAYDGQKRIVFRIWWVLFSQLGIRSREQNARFSFHPPTNMCIKPAQINLRWRCDTCFMLTKRPSYHIRGHLLEGREVRGTGMMWQAQIKIWEEWYGRVER